MTEEQIKKRNAANRRKGKRWEYELREGLRSVGEDVEALRQTGTKDEGDLVVRRASVSGTRYVVIEAKNARLEPSKFVAEAQVEKEHFAANRRLGLSSVNGIAVVKRPGLNWRKALVITTVEDYFGLTDGDD